MTIAPFATAGENAWSQLTINGVRVPGLVTVSGTGLGRSIDAKVKEGETGATYTDKGHKLAKPRIDVEVWTQAQADELSSMLETIRSPEATQSLTPVDVDHPGLALIGVRRLLIESIDLPKVSKDGRLSVSISTIEHRPAPVPLRGDSSVSARAVAAIRDSVIKHATTVGSAFQAIGRSFGIGAPYGSDSTSSRI